MLIIIWKKSELAEIISVNGSLKSKREKDLTFLDFYIVQFGVAVVDEFNLLLKMIISFQII